MRLRIIRKQRGLTQEQLEERSGVHQAIISSLELGKIKKPSWDIVYRLSKALETPPEDLFPVEDIAA